MFRNVSKVRTQSFLGLFQFVSADSLYNLYVSMFRNKKYMAWNFTFSLTLFQFVAKCFETFQISDLVIFGSVSICFS